MILGELLEKDPLTNLFCPPGNIYGNAKRFVDRTLWLVESTPRLNGKFQATLMASKKGLDFVNAATVTS